MWDAFKDWIFSCIQFFSNFVGDWGLAIIIITVIFRLIVAPIMHKQIKSSFQMQKIQPLIKEVQTKFSNDPVRMNEEMQKLYAETKFNPLAGCLPMLLQMPIFLAMFQTLRELGGRQTGTSYTFYGMVPDLTLTPSEMFSHGIAAFFPYLVLMLVFALATFLPMILQNIHNDSAQRNQMLIMGGVMTLMMLWISWGPLPRFAVLGHFVCYRYSSEPDHHAYDEKGRSCQRGGNDRREAGQGQRGA